MFVFLFTHKVVQTSTVDCSGFLFYRSNFNIRFNQHIYRFNRHFVGIVGIFNYTLRDSFVSYYCKNIAFLSCFFIKFTDAGFGINRYLIIWDNSFVWKTRPIHQGLRYHLMFMTSFSYEFTRRSFLRWDVNAPQACIASKHARAHANKHVGQHHYSHLSIPPSHCWDIFNYHELVSIPELEGRDFSLEACRSMLSMVDRDRNGKLDYDEFRELWRTVMEWKNNFGAYDKDNSGDMSAIELRDALSKLGFKLSTPALSSIALRYANKHGGVSMDDYIQICCRVKSTFGMDKHFLLILIDQDVLVNSPLFFRHTEFWDKCHT